MGHIVKAGRQPTAVTAPRPATAAAPTASTTPAEDVAAMLVQARAEAKAAAILLARKMAEKIVGHAVAVDPAVMRDIAGQALKTAALDQVAVSLRVHPEDLAGLRAERTAWLSDLGVKADVTFVADPEVGRYGCVVETAAGRIDARLAAQLDAIEGALRRVGGNRP